MFAGRLVLAPTADAGSPDGLAAPAKAASSRPRSDRPVTPGSRPWASYPGAFTRASCSPWRKATWIVFAGRTRYPANAGRQEQRDADTPPVPAAHLPISRQRAETRQVDTRLRLPL